MSASTEATDMAAAAKTTTTAATVGTCQTRLSQGNRCDAN
jgi:hypothetical protein